MSRKTYAMAVALLGLASGLAPAAAAAHEAPWLFVSDIHLDPRAADPLPASFGKDTNAVLLRSALAEMRRVAPDPPVVVIAGDFLAHDIRRRDATATEVTIARAFDRAFPHAQFVVTLGNEDSDCGDYGVAPNSAFLRAFARAWAPLVNRRGAAPAFTTTFVRDGFYVARLPLHGVHAVVVDNVPWSPRFHLCGSPANRTHVFSELEAALRPGRDRVWVVLHIPPGIDAYSTIRLAHDLVVVPLLAPRARASFVHLADAPEDKVALIVAGHTHRFAFRILRDDRAAQAPLLGVPAISPIYGNTPSFLTADVEPDGTVVSADEHSLVAGRWTDVGGTRDLGLSAIDTPQLVALQLRLTRSAPLRATWSRLYNGAGRSEITERTWHNYWCVTGALTATGYRNCTGAGGISVLTRLGIIVGVAVLLGFVLLVAGLIVLVAINARSELRG